MNNVLITGVSGFLGSRLVNIMNRIPDTKIVLLTSRSCKGYLNILYTPDFTGGGYKHTVDDFLKIGIDHFDVVIHIGGFVPVTKEEQNDYSKNYSSIVNTKYLLDHLPGKTGVFIYCSSMSVYGLYAEHFTKGNKKYITEESLVNPDTQYGLAKYCCELLIKDWANFNDVKYRILRITNIYGPGDNRKNSLMSAWINDAFEGRDVRIYGDPNVKRNYMYVDDVCKFIISSTKLKEDYQVINVVSEDISLKNIAETIGTILGCKIRQDSFQQSFPLNGELLYLPDARKRLLGEEDFDLSKGIYELCKHVIEQNK